MKKFNKLIILTSAILNGILGILITFLPLETGQLLGITTQTEANLLVMKMLGAALFGFGLMNYMARGVTLGGIYGKPILLGNLIFHFVAALELIRYLFEVNQFGYLLVFAILYAFLTAGLIRMNFTSPIWFIPKPHISRSQKLPWARRSKTDAVSIQNVCDQVGCSSNAAHGNFWREHNLKQYIEMKTKNRLVTYCCTINCNYFK